MSQGRKSGLAARIVLAMVAAVLITALGSFAFSYVAADRAFGTYVRRFQSMRQQRVVSALESYWETNGSWLGVQTVLDSALRPGSGMGMSAGMGMGRMMGAESDRIMLLSPAGAVIADTAGIKVGTVIKFEPWEILSLQSKGNTVGLLLMGSPEERAQSISLYTEFTGSLKTGTLISVGLAAIIALAIGYVIAERTLRPVRELTGAVAEVGKGNLTVRVPRRGDDEIASLGEAFNTMSAALEQAEKSRKDLVADVSHELRTPLSVLKSNLEGIRDGVIPATDETLAMLEQQVERLARLVADLHVLALADAGRLDLQMAPMDLAVSVRNAAGAFAALAASRDVRVMLTGVEHAGVSGDAMRLAQVISNLVDNAIRHTPAGGHVSVDTDIEDFEHGRFVSVKVGDTGEGISPDDLPHIFDRFYRGDKSRSRSTGGSGLGLAIASEIVRAHGGELLVRSLPGEGSTFTMLIPSTKGG